MSVIAMLGQLSVTISAVAVFQLPGLLKMNPVRISYGGTLLLRLLLFSALLVPCTVKAQSPTASDMATRPAILGSLEKGKYSNPVIGFELQLDPACTFADEARAIAWSTKFFAATQSRPWLRRQSVFAQLVSASCRRGDQFRNNVIQNNAQRGLTVNDGSQVSSSNDKFVGNVSSGIFMNSGAYLAATNSVIQNNGTDGSDATVVADHSTLRLIACTISGNLQNGVSLQRSSEARFDSPSIVSGNGGTGVSVRDLSFAFFQPGNTVTGNLAGTDVLCSPQFSATRGALTNVGGGTTNCVEP